MVFVVFELFGALDGWISSVVLWWLYCSCFRWFDASLWYFHVSLMIAFNGGSCSFIADFWWFMDQNLVDPPQLEKPLITVMNFNK